jgi:hypothetical protein
MQSYATKTTSTGREYNKEQHGMLFEVRCPQVGSNPTVDPFFRLKDKCKSTRKAGNDEQVPKQATRRYAGGFKPCHAAPPTQISNTQEVYEKFKSPNTRQ